MLDSFKDSSTKAHPSKNQRSVVNTDGWYPDLHTSGQGRLEGKPEPLGEMHLGACHRHQHRDEAETSSRLPAPPLFPLRPRPSLRVGISPKGAFPGLLLGPKIPRVTALLAGVPRLASHGSSSLPDVPIPESLLLTNLSQRPSLGGAEGVCPARKGSAEGRTEKSNMRLVFI